MAQKADSAKRSFLPTNLTVGMDLISAGKNKWRENFTGAEYTASIDVGRYLLSADVGNWGKTVTDSANVYRNDGHYYRIGVDVNFLTKDPDHNICFLGLRRGQSSFSESLVGGFSDPLFGDTVLTYRNDHARARWYELTGGLKVKIWKWIWMGYTARYKFGLKTASDLNLKPYDVPGYGQTFQTSTWGFNYYLFLHIPLRKAKPSPAPSP